MHKYRRKRTRREFRSSLVLVGLATKPIFPGCSPIWGSARGSWPLVSSVLLRLRFCAQGRLRIGFTFLEFPPPAPLRIRFVFREGDYLTPQGMHVHMTGLSTPWPPETRRLARAIELRSHFAYKLGSYSHAQGVFPCLRFPNGISAAIHPGWAPYFYPPGWWMLEFSMANDWDHSSRFYA